MNTEFGKLPKAEQEQVELDYHQMNPEAFEALMKGAEPHTPDVIRLPPRLVKTLKAVAESSGESGYQAMVRRWIEERLRQEAKLAS